jgi:hypothetical protein
MQGRNKEIINSGRGEDHSKQLRTYSAILGAGHHTSKEEKQKRVREKSLQEQARKKRRSDK